uniref:uncharacterized protein n=1 Tax=Semicossyphus pulcher TaxID=241346 RepID=UPI0037E956CD
MEAADLHRMRMTGRVTWCGAALLLALTSVSAVKKLDSIDDLKEIKFGQSVPTHSLVLLYWFANTVNIDHNDVIQLTFDPEDGDYGSHYYSNFEGLLDQPHHGQRYYTVGNLYKDTSRRLPSYVINPRRQYRTGNRDRIIIRVRGQRIDQVYITQHYDNSGHEGRPYDPDHTYQITTNLLRQIREFPVGGNDQNLSSLRNRFRSDADVSHIRNTWGDLACLGLFLFIVMQDKHISNRHNRHNDPDDDAFRRTVIILLILFICVWHFLTHRESR